MPFCVTRTAFGFTLFVSGVTITFPDRSVVSGLSATETEILSPEAVTVIQSLAASSGAAVHVSFASLTATTTSCAGAPSPSNVRAVGSSEKERSPTSAPSCETVTRFGSTLTLSGVRVNEPLRAVSASLSETETVSVLPSEFSVTVIHALDSSDMVISHPTFSAVTVTVLLELPEAANASSEGETVSVGFT